MPGVGERNPGRQDKLSAEMLWIEQHGHVPLVLQSRLVRSRLSAMDDFHERREAAWGAGQLVSCWQLIAGDRETRGRENKSFNWPRRCERAGIAVGVI